MTNTIHTGTLIAVLLIIAMQTAVFAQTPCTKEDAFNNTGAWVRSSAIRPAVKLSPAALVRANRLMEMMKKAIPVPSGAEASVSLGQAWPPITRGASAYSIESNYNFYYCVPDDPSYPEIRGTIQINSESSTDINIDINNLGWLVSDATSLPDGFVLPDGSRIFAGLQPAGDFNDAIRYEPKLFRGKDEAFVFTIGGRSPFRSVSREEFVQVRAKLTRKEIAKMDDQMAKMGAAQPQLKTMGLKMRDELERQLGKMLSDFSSMPVEYRTGPAYVGNPRASLDAVFAEPKQGGKPVVVIDRSIADPGRAADTVQLITVYLKWNNISPAGERLMREFKKNFNFTELKKMLGT